jgi:hypothetical protein
VQRRCRKDVKIDRIDLIDLPALLDQIAKISHLDRLDQIDQRPCNAPSALRPWTRTHHANVQRHGHCLRHTPKAHGWPS